jgi:hypothetical protein
VPGNAAGVNPGGDGRGLASDGETPAVVGASLGGAHPDRRSGDGDTGRIDDDATDGAGLRQRRPGQAQQDDRYVNEQGAKRGTHQQHNENSPGTIERETTAGPPGMHGRSIHSGYFEPA